MNNERILSKIRPNKKTYYKEEREQIFNEILNIISLDNNNSVLLVELNENKKLLDKLMNSIDIIKKCYRCSSWGYFVSENHNLKGNPISLLRAIMKDHGYTIYSKNIIKEYNGVKQKYTQLTFIK